MGSCDFDHPVEDVKQKLADQKPFLPKNLFDSSAKLLEQKPDQHTLNELFHFLKKYDLASEEERTKRNEGIKQLV